MYFLIIHNPTHITHASHNVLPFCCHYHKPRGESDLEPKANQQPCFKDQGKTLHAPIISQPPAQLTGEKLSIPHVAHMP